MSLDVQHSIDYTSWAKRANARWIVHGGLSKSAEDYMRHLEQTDPSRLAASCHNAYLMVWQRDSMEDPKPWFYGGLFSLATREEADRFACNHWLTYNLIVPETGLPEPTGISDVTREKIKSLREAIARLPKRRC